MRIAGWSPRASSRSSSSASLRSSADAVEHRSGGRRVVAQGFLGHAQVQGEGDEALLGAVVEVALESPPLGVGGVDDARS